jgi:hypothetical protein
MVRRLAIVCAALVVIFAGCFGALWWRLGAGPINLEMATPWLATAIEENFGHGNTVEVGGTQIERTGRSRIAVRIRDIIVRDRDHAIVASVPKAEVRLSGSALLMGRLRAESLNLVDAELAVRIAPDGNVTVSAGDNAKPLSTGVASKNEAGLVPTFPRQTRGTPPGGAAASSPQGQYAPAAPAQDNVQSGLLAGLDWLDSLSLTGLDELNLNEIGLKDGSLVIDDQRRGNKWSFENISLSLRRPSSGGVALSLGEEGSRAWSLRVAVGPAENGVRSVDIRADKVSTSNILLALRMKDLTYSANLPVTGELKGELGGDGLPTYFRGKITAGAGTVIDSDAPDYPMAIDSAEVSVEWDSGRRVLVAPVKIVSGGNRIALLAHLEPPNGDVTDWQLGLSGGTVVLGGNDGSEPPLIFNRIAIGLRFDTDKKRVLLTQADISNGEIGVAATGSVDYSGEPRLTLGFAGTPMSAQALKRMWPILVVPEVREWVIERIERGSMQRIEVGVNSPVRNLSRKGPPIPDDGLTVAIVANGVTLRPVDGLPSIRDADLKAHITGRTANVSIGQGAADTPAGRKIIVSDAVFEIADTAPKPVQAKVRFRIDGPVPLVAETLASGKLSDLSAIVVDPNASKGTGSASVSLTLPIKRDITRLETKLQSTRVEDIVIEGGGASIKGSLEVDQNGDLINANFPTFALARGDKTSLQAERGPDGAIKVTMRGDVLDARGFLKSTTTGNSEDDSRSNMRKVDADVDLRLDAVLGFNGEVVRSVDAKMSRRGGTIRSFLLSGKLGRDTPIKADLRARTEGRAAIYLETNDAGAFLRFTDTYSKVIGGQLKLAIDTPTVEPGPREGLLNVRDFTIKGEASLDRLAADSPAGAQSGISFSRLRAEFIGQNGQLTIRDGILKGPRVGGTIEGDIDYPGNQVRIGGTFVPLYGLNNMFGQVPVLGLFLGGGSNEGLIGVTYEVVGTPGQPVFRVNPISALAPGVLRKILEGNKNPNDFPPNN